MTIAQKEFERLLKKTKNQKVIGVLRQKQIDFVGLRDFHRDLMNYYDEACGEIAEELRKARTWIYQK